MADQDDIDLVGLVVDTVLEHPLAQSCIDRVTAAVEQAPGRIVQHFQRREQPQGPRVHVQRVPVRDPIASARASLQFGPDEPLTLAKVKERKRFLAKRLHSDRGGDDQVLARINAAATLLEGHLK